MIDGYLPFAFDVTGKLKDSVNHLVLRVDNRPRIDWLPAAKQIEWVQYGGILQPVRVESKGPIFLSDLAIRAVPAKATVPRSRAASSSMPATERTPPASSSRSASSTVSGQMPLAQAAAPPTRSRSARRPARKSTLDARSCHDLVAGVAGPVHPGRDSGTRGKEIDRLVSPFGVRTIAARGRQLLLNGRPLKIRGVNRYDEYGRFGPNPPQGLVEDELRLMKKAGVNLIRTHYPQAPEFLALCDRLGILFLEELPINWWGVEWFGKEGRGAGRAHPGSRPADARDDDPSRPEPPQRDHLEHGQRVEDRQRGRDQGHARA